MAVVRFRYAVMVLALACVLTSILAPMPAAGAPHSGPVPALSPLRPVAYMPGLFRSSLLRVPSHFYLPVLMRP